NEKRQTLYLGQGVKTGPGDVVREMDCMDCHNRPSHSYELPERAMDTAMYNGSISAALPYARKKGVELLRAKYSSRDDASHRIPAEWEKFYEQQYPAAYSQH